MAERRKENPEQKGVKIQLLTRVLVVLGLTLLVFLAVSLYTVVSDYNRLAKSFEVHIKSSDSMEDLKNGSDDLTEQSRRFAVTGDPAAMQKYFEVVDNKIREKAYSDLVRWFPNEEAIKSMRIALKESDALMDAEIHSMKLISQAENTDENEIPKAVRDYRLPAEEESWTGSKKTEVAIELVFGRQYIKDKKRIDTDIQNAVDEMSGDLQDDMNSGLLKVGSLIQRMIVLGVLLALLLIAVFITVRCLIIRPIRVYIQCIKENRRLEMVGAGELKYLAVTYNDMFEKNEVAKKRTDYLLEHDPLTGACNRHGFEEQKKALIKSNVPIAFIVFDIDNFKEVNDTYGHDIGDQALQYVVTTVRKHLRSDDILARIGGDEFVGVLANIYPENRDVIGEKLENINRALQDSEEGLPKLSISIGVSFSEQGYHQDLFRQADKALYEAKVNGKKGYAFFRHGVEE